MCVRDDAEGEGSTEEDQDDGDEEEATPKEEQADVEAIVSAAVAAAEERGEKLRWLELDELDISDDDLRRLDLPTKCPVIPLGLQSVKMLLGSFSLLLQRMCFSWCRIWLGLAFGATRWSRWRQ